MTETRNSSSSSSSSATATTTTTTRKNKSGKGNLFILLLFTSILAHGILFSSRSIKPPLVSRQIIEYGDNNNNNNNNVADVADVTDVDSYSEYNSVTATHQQQQQQQEQQEQQQQEKQEQQQHSLRMRSTVTVHDDNEQTQTQLPHWRLATDCSSYNLDCFTRARRENKYRSYPFPPSFKDIQEEEWSVETFDQIPVDWIEYLEKDSTMANNNNNNNNNNKSSTIEERNYLYPPTVSDAEYRTCFDLAVGQNKSTTEQLDDMLSGEFPRIVPEPDTNMVAFTISDYSYVQDMIHDVFQMMEDTVGFSNSHFFLVALDPRSVELACRYGYSVILWKADVGNLKNAVANTKVILSHELVKRGIDFFFTEMDVWWIRSPKSNLIEFQNRHNHDNNNSNNQEEVQKSSDEGKHIYFSGHQNNYNAPNIGVYAVKADEYSEEYFRVCLDVLKEKPDTHDQWVLAEVHRLFQHTYHNVTYNFGGTFEPDGPPETPTIQHPFIAKMFSPHEVVADERPMPTHQMLALHTLNNAPLQMPHGKKMIAKELGAYHGFKTHPGSSSIHNKNDDDSNSSVPSSGDDSAGYYERSGESYRKYLWLDGELRSNFYSIAHQNRYHDKVVLRWTLAILIAIARKTNRIFVLPQIFDADMDAGTYFSWTYMDYSKVSEMVDFRETNFISNPKAWRSTDGSGSVGSDHKDRWPFESVVNTAFYQGDDGYDISIYTEVSNRSSIISKQVWKANLDEHDRLDAWIGSLSTVPELESAEVLLINPDFMMESGYLGGVVSRMKHYQAELEKRNEDSDSKNEETNNHDERRLPPVGRFELEILEIYDLLRWCLDDNRRHTVSKASASDSCYGIGDRKN